jgi:hypothetical protein
MIWTEVCLQAMISTPRVPYRGLPCRTDLVVHKHCGWCKSRNFPTTTTTIVNSSPSLNLQTFSSLGAQHMSPTVIHQQNPSTTQRLQGWSNCMSMQGTHFEAARSERSLHRRTKTSSKSYPQLDICRESSTPRHRPTEHKQTARGERHVKKSERLMS